MDEVLIVTSLVVGEKGGGIFNFNPSPKKPGYFIFGVKMEIGYRQIVPAIEANKFLLGYQPVSTGNAQSWEKKFHDIG